MLISFLILAIIAYKLRMCKNSLYKQILISEIIIIELNGKKKLKKFSARQTQANQFHVEMRRGRPGLP